MSVNEPEDSEPLVFSQILGPIRNRFRENVLRSPALSEEHDSDATEEGVIAPVGVGRLLRVDLLRSPALSEDQDSDATEEGVVAPVRVGQLHRMVFNRSPAPYEVQDSDDTEEGIVAPVALGIQQQPPSASLTNEEEPIEERNLPINLGVDVRPAPDLASDNPGIESRPSVIFTGANVANVRADQNDNIEDTFPEQANVRVHPDYSDGIILMTSPTFDFLDTEPMQDETFPPIQDDVAGPSNRPDGVTHFTTQPAASGDHSAENEGAIDPVAINQPSSPRPDTSGQVNEASPSQNIGGTSGETAQAESGPLVVAPIAAEAASLSDAAFAPPCKRPRLSGSPVAPPKPNLNDSDEDDGLTCTICLDHWTSSGEHRLISLKCGHLFGFSCIERWIKNQKAAERKCPTCKTKTRMTDVRNLYGHKIQMIDTTELEEFRGKTKELVKEKEDLVREVGYLRKLNDELHVKNREAAMEIQKLKSETLVQRPIKKSSQVPHVKYRVSLVQTLELSKNEGCRVVTFNEVRGIIAASVPTPTNLFKEYALKLIDAESFKPRQTMPSHSRMIRDVAFSNDGKMLLSCSLDKTANVLDMESNTSIAVLQSEMPLWSVCWDAVNPWLCFTGAQNGVVQQFDVRHPGVELSRVVMAGNRTPVASLAGIPTSSGVGWPRGGFISCLLRHLGPYERTEDGFTHHPWNIDGLFTSLRYERRTEHVLVSTRPAEKSPRAQHMLFQLSAAGSNPQYNLVQNFFGSTTQGVISRSCLMPVLSPQGEVDDLLVSSYVQSDSHIGLWSCSSGQKLQNIESREITMDLCPIYANGKNYLCSLSDKKIKLYKVEKS